MKNGIQLAIGKRQLAGRLFVSAILTFTVAAAAPRAASAGAVRPVRADKGATRLMSHPEPERLPSEVNNPGLWVLAEGWERLGVECLRVTTVRSNQNAKVAIYRIRPAPERPILVFVHGVLADHETWRYMAAALADDYELWLVDLPGCGESDPLKVSATELDSYSPTAMGERVLQAVQSCLAQATPGQRLTIVGHSLGASVVIRMVSSPDLQTRYQEVLNRVDRAVLFAPCDFAINALPTKFIPVMSLQHWMVVLGGALGATDEKFRMAVRASYQHHECATVEQQLRLAHNLKDAKHLKTTQRMLRSAVPFDLKTLRPKWDQIEELVADYARIRVPVLIAYGARDETLSAAMGNKLKDEIPGAWLVNVAGCGHSLPTECPEECVRLLRWFESGASQVDVLPRETLKIYPPAVSAPLIAERK